MYEKRFLFAALIPHRDCLPPAQTAQQELFKQGLYGAFSFPLSCPLALISRSLNKDELKKLALALSEKTRSPEGKIIAGEWTELSFAGLRFGGQKLNIPPLSAEDFPSYTIKEISPFPFLAECLLNHESALPTGKLFYSSGNAFLPAPLSFRAAAVSNVTLTPLSDDGYSFSWNIHGQVWLTNRRRRLDQ